MTIKVYISGICGSQEVRKQQQRVLFILQSLPIDLQVIDVTEPGRDEDLTFMQETAKKHEKKMQLPPQIFNENEYCGDYADFELANDDDDIMKFLKLETGAMKAEVLTSCGDIITQNGIGNHENDLEASETHGPNSVSEIGEGELSQSQNDSNAQNSDEVQNVEIETQSSVEAVSETPNVESTDVLKSNEATEIKTEESEESEEESE